MAVFTSTPNGCGAGGPMKLYKGSISVHLGWGLDRNFDQFPAHNKGYICLVPVLHIPHDPNRDTQAHVRKIQGLGVQIDPLVGGK